MTFTKQQVIDAVRNRLKRFNYGNPEFQLDGLTLKDHEMIGDIIAALNEAEVMSSFVTRTPEDLYASRNNAYKLLIP